MNAARSKASNNSSGSEGEHSTDDIWDDTLIIRNYDESLAMVREEVAKRLAMKTNKKMLAKAAGATPKEQQQQQQQQQPQASTSTQQIKLKTEEGESSGVENSATEKGACETSGKPSYQVGDYCRATYDDGVDYEAKILAVDKSGDALIRYVGYNNEQTVAIEDLVPSWGRKARRKQREDAAELAAAEEDPNRMEMSDDEVKLTDKANKIRINIDPNFRMPRASGGGPSRVASTGFHAGMGASFMVPPPPPMPPMLEDDDDLESENLSAMLMSWYMSGYYTGLYHGQKMSQKRARPS